MELKVANGTTVHRIYGKNSEAEWIAAFQYGRDAERFVQQTILDDASSRIGVHYIVTDHGTGGIKIFWNREAAALTSGD